MIRTMTVTGFMAVAGCFTTGAALARHYANPDVVGTICFSSAAPSEGRVRYTQRMESHYGDKCWYPEAGRTHSAKASHGEKHHAEASPPKRVYPPILPATAQAAAPATVYLLPDVPHIKHVKAVETTPTQRLQAMISVGGPALSFHWTDDYKVWSQRNHVDDFEQTTQARWITRTKLRIGAYDASNDQSPLY